MPLDRKPKKTGLGPSMALSGGFVSDDGASHSGTIDLVYRSGLGFPAVGRASSQRSSGEFPSTVFFKEQVDGVCESLDQLPFG